MASNAKKQLEESMRHNKTMKSIAMGKGLYLKPYKNGYGIMCDNINTKKLISKLSKRPLTNIDLEVSL